MGRGYDFMDTNTSADAVSQQLDQDVNTEEAEVDEEGIPEDLRPITPHERAMYAVAELMYYIGADLNDPNCIDTPMRVVKAWKEYWGAGYEQKSSDFLTVFPNEGYDQMITVENIPVHSTCSHHLAPITGYACVSIIPRKELIGLSKYARVVDMYARRLQLQERLTLEIADELMGLLKPLGVAVFIRASHGCMSSRGVKIHGSTTVTTALRGVFRTNEDTRAEFMAIAQHTKGG